MTSDRVLRAEIVDGKRTAVVRTHERIQFRRCRRKWGWGGLLRANLTKNEGRAPLWLGTGFHFAMEDYHGFRFFEHPKDALQAYYKATKAAPKAKSIIPADVTDLLELGTGMLEYYVEWLNHGRSNLTTYWHNGWPQVEVNFELELPVDPEILERAEFDRCVYRGTLDRVVVDEDGLLWILDYKTAKNFVTGHLDTDPQITAYCWAGSVLYNRPVAGFIYQQHRKVIPSEPEFLKSGKYSTNKQQITTHALYRKALTNLYGDVRKAPQENQDFLDWLASQEQPDYDALVRRDWVSRNSHAIAAEGVKVLLEVEDMLNPDLPLYPNPTRDCSWDCDFLSVCQSLDDGSDWEYELKSNFISRSDPETSWRKYLQLPPQPQINPPEMAQLNQLPVGLKQVRLQNPL